MNAFRFCPTCATPLELLFDLTFVVAFGIAASALFLVSGSGLSWYAYATEARS